VRLGERWKHIRLDKVYTSPSARAYATALALVEPRAGAAIRTVSSALTLNTAAGTSSSSLFKRSKKPPQQHDFPSISTVASVPVPRALPCLREQDQGAVAVSPHQPGSAVQPSSAPRPTSTLADERAFKCPGGESLDDVSQRARAFVLDTLLAHAAAWPTMGMHRPKPLNPDSAPPADVPHVVVVSHNVFLTELFELLACWEKKEHVMTTYQLELMQWYVDFFSLGSCLVSFSKILVRSRHVISFEGPPSEPRNLRLHTLYTPTPIRKYRS
jgi:broad specificity phosphatase PhoE